MEERIVKLLEPMKKRPGVSEESPHRLCRAVGAELPAEYLEFLRWSDGAKGPMRPYLPLIAERLTDAPHHVLFSAEEVLELTVSPKSYAQKWRALYPGYLVISFGAGYLGLLDLVGRKPETMTYAVADEFLD
jgi:hypothetical protein